MKNAWTGEDGVTGVYTQRRRKGDCMGLNISKGDMYPWVTHTWNTVKGKCPHNCSYCYMKRWGQQHQLYFDVKEFKQFEMGMKKYGENLFIFVGSSCDMFAEAVPAEWIMATLRYCGRFNQNRYLFQSKNPYGFRWLQQIIDEEHIKLDATICTTIETNRWYPEIMRSSPDVKDRSREMANLSRFPRYVTIEPIMDFDITPMVELIKQCEPIQVNIGADSGNNNLPEPPAEKIFALIDELKKFTTIANKRNLDRIMGGKNE